eukprot:TRINITY_DN1586_c0_g1_i1.p1 TRINITY_DN1586_c0_g1~~TRINITY_DN1586_c0_g1_i1.p1  ORF type:complete len:199 (+),score=50.08 TRINITY_DN1586_c0_g1_i1:71-667(+)
MVKKRSSVQKASLKKQQKLKKSRPGDVEVRESKIPGAGKGLFARRDFAKGTLLPAPYRGRRLSLDQFKRLRDFRWCFEIAEGKCWAVDGKALKSGNPCRWVNGARTGAQRRQVNVVGLKMEDGNAWFATLKAVPAGTEFLIDYGPGYWQAYEEHWGKPERIRAKISKLRGLRRAASGNKRRQIEEMLEDALDELEAHI